MTLRFSSELFICILSKNSHLADNTAHIVSGELTSDKTAASRCTGHAEHIYMTKILCEMFLRVCLYDPNKN